MTDILDYLEADLDALRDLVFELRLANENSQEEADAFTALVTLVEAQDEAREAILLPLGSDLTSLKAAVREATDRMHGARDVETMIECCTNRSTWRASVNVYCELLEKRIWQERRGLFPALHDELSLSERLKLGQMYKRYRGFGPTSSHRKNWQKVWASIFNQAG